MVWIAISYTGKSNIKFVSNKMSSKIYIQTIQQLLIDVCLLNGCRKFYFSNHDDSSKVR